MARDLIRLLDIRCRCRVGVPAAERARPQTILIDAALEVDAARAAARDDFREAVDYQAVERAIRAEVEAGERALLETLAERAAAAALKNQPRAAAVTIAARKSPAAMPKTRAVVVEIRRERR